MTILTPEIIEKAARAIFEEKTGLTSWEGTVFKDRFCDYARAALEAVLPDVVERCAQEIEAEDQATCSAGEVWAYSRAVELVRSLLPKEDGNGR